MLYAIITIYFMVNCLITGFMIGYDNERMTLLHYLIALLFILCGLPYMIAVVVLEKIDARFYYEYYFTDTWRNLNEQQINNIIKARDKAVSSKRKNKLNKVLKRHGHHA